MAREIVYSEDGIINARVKQKIDTLPNWEALDMTILDGEQAFVRTPEGVPINFKIGDGTKPFRDLPFWLDSGSPFKLRSTDTDYVQVTGGNTVVTHPGLIGFDDYPVTTTQLNIAAFRDNDLVYDSVNGSVTITGFELQAGELLILSPPSMKWAETTGSGSALQALVARVDELERMAAPFVVDELTGESNGRVWWPVDRPIPAGWAIDTSAPGMAAVSVDPSDAAINLPGKTTGAKSVTLSGDQQGRLTLGLMPGWSSGTSSVKQFRGLRMKPEGAPSWTFDIRSEDFPEGQYTPDFTVGVGDASQAHSNVQPSQAGYWIKYVGV